MLSYLSEWALNPDRRGKIVAFTSHRSLAGEGDIIAHSVGIERDREGRGDGGKGGSLERGGETKQRDRIRERVRGKIGARGSVHRKEAISRILTDWSR